ncbi:MAG: DUF3326 domain-containing protein [Candidatus Sericytochromatia bacterium]|nr:DUF3326 domain-containing protein [Candidatus Sericytochromatia bacterium]
MFRIVFVVPTGVGASVGGFAGDAGLVTAYLGQIADEILTHPNVVNAAGFNALPPNGLYIEGHALNQFFTEQWGFQKVRSNRIGLVIDRRCEPWLDLIANAVNATAMSTGCQISGYTLTDQAVDLQLYPNDWGYTGEVNNLEQLITAGQRCLNAGADALAVLVWFDVLSDSDNPDYFYGQGVDPIGAMEALISHALVAELKVPVAHSPIFTPQIVSQRLDPRVAAEEIGTTYLPCILMGLSRAPRYVPYAEGDFSLKEIDAVLAPRGACGGLPMLVAAQRQIPLLVVGENQSVLPVSPDSLGWSHDQIFEVANYWEAAGLLTALKQGIDPWLLRRPLPIDFKPF